MIEQQPLWLPHQPLYAHPHHYCLRLMASYRMSAQQVNTLLGRPASLTATGHAIAYITAQAIHTIGFGWAAGTIDGARRTWIRLIAFAQRTNAMAGLDKFYFHGFIVAGFLSAVDAEARADYKSKNPNKPKHAMDAKGDSAIGAARRRHACS